MKLVQFLRSLFVSLFYGDFYSLETQKITSIEISYIHLDFLAIRTFSIVWFLLSLDG